MLKKYRIYSERNLEQLQQILFFRQLGMPLKEIKVIIGSATFNQLEALEMHREILIEKRENINCLIQTIDKTIQYKKGEIEMSLEEKFSGFNFDENNYEEEARERWGDAAVDEANAKKANWTKGEKKRMEKELEKTFKRLAKIRHLAPDSEEAQEAIEQWWQYLNKIGSYSLDAFKGLGEMYVADNRFMNNIDQFGEGLATFMCEAMRIFSEQHKS